MLERDEGNVQLARELLKCAVKADPRSEPSWLVSGAAFGVVAGWLVRAGRVEGQGGRWEALKTEAD